MGQVRDGVDGDVESMARLAARKREAYRDHASRFHRPAEDATERHRPFLRQLVENEDSITLVCVEGDEVVGFVIGVLRPPPPVYDPGGPTLLVDDFCVADPAEWSTVGAKLLAEVERRGRDRGAVQTVVVCGPQDVPKRRMLEQREMVVASEWWTAPLD